MAAPEAGTGPFVTLAPPRCSYSCHSYAVTSDLPRFEAPAQSPALPLRPARVSLGDPQWVPRHRPAREGRMLGEVRNREIEILDDLEEMPNGDLLRVREVLVSLGQTAQYAVRNAEIATNLALNEESTHVSIE